MENETLAENNVKKNERANQKALIMLAGAGALFAASRVLQDRPFFNNIGNFFNLSAGEFQAACGLSGILAALGVVAREDIAAPCRSMAWRVPVIAAVGGLISHPKAHEGLSHIPLGIGSWFAANPVFVANGQTKMGIAAIYSVGAWSMLKPSCDRVEQWTSDKYLEYHARHELDDQE